MVRFLVKMLNTLIPKKKNKWVFLSHPDYTDNPRSFYELINAKFPDISCTWIVSDPELGKLMKSSGIRAVRKNSVMGFFAFARSKVVITSHTNLSSIRSKRQVFINLWHGVPLKCIEFMDKNENKKNIPKLNDSKAITISTSDTVSSLLSACFHVNHEHIYVTGQPRNDKLFSPITTTELLNLVDIKSKDFDHVVFYMPTFRQGYINRKEGRQFDESNIFGFENFDKNKFSTFLEENKILFLCKLHPFEETMFKNKIDELGKYVHLIKNDDLFRKDINLYSLIAKSDILITDYSSVYFDYLLINKPIIFVPTDLEEYRKKRGFVIEPYDFWAPGPKAITQEKLQNEIIKCIENPEYYKDERKTVNNIINRYKDDRSSERVAQIIMKKINK